MAEKLFTVYLNGAPDPWDPAYIQPVRASQELKKLTGVLSSHILTGQSPLFLICPQCVPGAKQTDPIS
jgi:hypothetical protein